MEEPDLRMPQAVEGDSSDSSFITDDEDSDYWEVWMILKIFISNEVKIIELSDLFFFFHGIAFMFCTLDLLS
jgi:hypothetical protein